MYTNLLIALEEHDRVLEESVSKSWLYMLGCNDVTMASRCRGPDAKAVDCQCID